MEGFVQNFQGFMFILARIVGLMSSTPIYASTAISFQLRMIFSFLVTVVLYPVTAQFLPPIPNSTAGFFLIIAAELIMGLFMGFLISIIFAGFQMAGQYFSVQIGFAYTEVLDPVSQTNLPVISTLKNMLGMLLFLLTGAHRYLLESLYYSFEQVQILKFTATINSGLLKVLELAIGSMFIVAFRIALPVMGILVLVSIAEALMGKAAPQMNILMLSFPAKIAVGLIVMLLITPFIIQQMNMGIELSLDRLHLLLKEWPQ